jgi:hypothetical protein
MEAVHVRDGFEAALKSAPPIVRRAMLLGFLAIALAASPVTAAAAASTPGVRKQDAYVTRDENTQSWPVFEAIGAPVTLSHLTSLQVGAAGSDLVVVRGLAPPGRESFSIGRQTLAVGASLQLDEVNRSSETVLPMFAARAPEGVFFGGSTPIATRPGTP